MLKLHLKSYMFQWWVIQLFVFHQISWDTVSRKKSFTIKINSILEVDHWKVSREEQDFELLLLNCAPIVSVFPWYLKWSHVITVTQNNSTMAFIHSGLRFALALLTSLVQLHHTLSTPELYFQHLYPNIPLILSKLHVHVHANSQRKTLKHNTHKLYTKACYLILLYVWFGSFSPLGAKSYVSLFLPRIMFLQYQSKFLF